jgi:ribosomal protein S18 acetylase RimI-like enzyme
MIKIRPLGPWELRQVLALLGRYRHGESEYALLQQMQQLYIPMHRVSRSLPLNWQFLPGLFVAVADKKVLGLIWLSRDGQQARRWKIDHLILDPETSSYDMGTQLLSYVINRYGGDGVQTFLATVNQNDSISLGLLKSCGFRHCARLHYFSSRANLVLPENPTIEGLREFRSHHAPALAQLYQAMLPTEARICLEKSTADFQRSPLTCVGEHLRGAFFKRWVAVDAARDCLTASIELSSEDYQQFHIKLYIHPAWEALASQALAFAIAQAKRMTSQAQFTTDSYEFFSSVTPAIEAAGFHRDGISQVLVKDYWIPIEDKGSRLKSPLLLFSGRPSPAMN